MEPPARPTLPEPPTPGSSDGANRRPPTPPTPPPPLYPAPAIPSTTSSPAKQSSESDSSAVPARPSTSPEKRDQNADTPLLSGSDKPRSSFGAGIPLSRLDGMKKEGGTPPLSPKEPASPLKRESAPWPSLGEKPLRSNVTAGNAGGPVAPETGMNAVKKPESDKKLVPPLPGAISDVPLRPLTDTQLAASRSSSPAGASPRPLGVRSPGLSVPPPPRPPEESSGLKLPPLIPPGGLPPTTPPPTSPKVDRNIRPRRLAILILLLIGFIGGIILAVWVFLHGSTTSDVTPIPSGDQNLFASPPASAPAFGSDQDSDGDGLTDNTETQLGTDLTRADTDGDGYSDKQELDAGYDPLGPGKLDTDRDGLSDPAEACWNTDPRTPDTDGDGYLDGQEVTNNYNPTIPSPNDKLTTASTCPS